jgi:hypothetical protein
MKNYLISNIQEIFDVDGNLLGKRVCDISDSTFPVSDDYEWKQYEEFFDIYTGAWYWFDKPTEYIAPLPPVPEPIVEEVVVTPVVSEE